MTCKDCIYENKCISRISHFMDIDEATGKAITDIEKRCSDFKNKTDFVKVVRCRNCLHKINYKGRAMCTLYAEEALGVWYGLNATRDEHFCSYGKRRDI